MFVHALVSCLVATCLHNAAQAVPLSKPEVRSPYAVKETHFVPREWTNVGNPHPEANIDLKIGFVNKNFAKLEQQLYEVSHPSHPSYGQHLSKEEVDNLIRPDDKTQDLVSEWLQGHGLDMENCRYSSARDWISVSLPVSKVEEMLDTKYNVYQHMDGSTLIRTTEWSLPLHLHEHIQTIQPSTAFLRAAPQVQTLLLSPGEDFEVNAFPPNNSELAGSCNFEGMSPPCLRLLYGTADYTPRSPNSHIAFTNYLGEIPSRADASAFLRQFRPAAISVASSHDQISIAGGPIDNNGTTDPGYEGNLDLQTIAGQVGQNISITSYSTGGSPPFQPDLNAPTNSNEPYLVWLDYVLDQENLPQTISTSYGDDEQTVPESYALAVCQELAQLGLRGVSLLFSSGDSGVGANDTCVSNDGKNTTMFLPSFPASCPYITAVGGTRAYPEVVAFDSRNGFASGSGFSNYFEQPAYQKQSGVVDKYIDGLSGQFDGLYNKSGRAYPDLAAQAYRYIVFYNGSVVTLDGTSASAPTVASIIALVNDALMAAGKPPLGFLNPWLYSGAGAQAFHDITNGSSIGCNDAGFGAGPGWDAASGWGTPEFPKMLEILGISMTAV